MMAIKIGDRLPAVTLRQMTPKGPISVTTDGLFAGKRVVLFAVPGAFTPASTQQHLPGFVAKASELKKMGVDEIVCTAVNDPFVLAAWGHAAESEGKVTMLADNSGDFARAVGLELDLGKQGLGMRSQRYSMFVEDGIVKRLHVEPTATQVKVSGAEIMLGALEGDIKDKKG